STVAALRARIFAWLVALAVVPPAFAQVAGAALTGAIADQAGAAVPGATVTVVNTGTNRTRVAATTAGGIYTLPGLAPGEYRIEVALAGFRTIKHGGVRLATGDTARIDFVLAVGDVREEVTVAAGAPPLRAEKASLGAIVRQEQVVQLPLNGRTFVTLASLAPGVALPPASQLPRI